MIRLLGEKYKIKIKIRKKFYKFFKSKLLRIRISRNRFINVLDIGIIY